MAKEESGREESWEELIAKVLEKERQRQVARNEKRRDRAREYWRRKRENR
jgi:hypothetical protein